MIFQEINPRRCGSHGRMGVDSAIRNWLCLGTRCRRFFFGSQEASPKSVFFEVFCERHQFIALNMVQKSIFIECAWPHFRFEIWRMATSDVSWTDGRIRHIHPDFSGKVLYR